MTSISATRPTSTSTPATSAQPAITIKAGDTLTSLATTHRTSVDALRQSNPQLANPDLLYPGQVLALPPASATATPATATPPAAPSGSAATSGAPPSAESSRASRSRAAAAGQLAAARIAAVPSTRLEAHIVAGRTLKEGARGAEVLDLQRFLGMKTVDQDGVFGPTTSGALRSFQGRSGIAADGVVGPATMAALKKAGMAAEDARSLALRIETGNPIREGESGSHVRGLQRLLGFGPAGQTGTFGPTTRAAVEDAQRRLLGMTPQSPGWGGVGPLTYRALQNVEGIRNASSSTAVAGAPSSQLRTLAQRDATSCGLTSVAMVTNAWNNALGTGAPPITDRTLRAEMGQADLRRAMTNHLPPGVRHYDRDWPRGARSFADIDAQLARGNPVIVGVGRPFTASGYGHIFVLGKKNTDGSYEVLDPNGGVRRNVSQATLANAGDHSEGSFYMVAERR